MARCRLIKPEFFEDTTVPELSPWARLLFIGLWTLSDRAGFLHDDPLWIKSKIFPHDAVDIGQLIMELHGKDMIRRFPAVEKHGWIWVRNFLKHQHPHPKEAQSVAPTLDMRAGRLIDKAVALQGEPCNSMEGSSVSNSNSDPNSNSNSNSRGHGTPRPTIALDEAYERLRDDYPRERVQDSVLIRQNFIRAFTGLENGNREALFDKMLAALTQHKRSEQWKIIKHIPMFGKWIEESRWLQTLDAAEQHQRAETTPVNASQVGKRATVPTGQPLDPRKPRR